jgi:hypothetical protein
MPEKTVHHLYACNLTAGEHGLEQRVRRRKPSLSKLIARAEKSGRPVSSITTTPDGYILTFGAPPKKADSNELDNWIEKHAGSIERH